MTEVTTLSIPQSVIAEAKLLGINCSKTARTAIKDEIHKRKQQKEAEKVSEDIQKTQ